MNPHQTETGIMEVTHNGVKLQTIYAIQSVGREYAINTVTHDTIPQVGSIYAKNAHQAKENLSMAIRKRLHCTIEFKKDLQDKKE
jgi:hypothetical protein